MSVDVIGQELQIGADAQVGAVGPDIRDIQHNFPWKLALYSERVLLDARNLAISLVERLAVSQGREETLGGASRLEEAIRIGIAGIQQISRRHAIASDCRLIIGGLRERRIPAKLEAKCPGDTITAT